MRSSGGWTVNGIYTYQTGAPLVWSNGSTTSIGDYVYFGGPLNLNQSQVNGDAFNTSVFDTKAADQFQFHVRTFSTTFPNLRQAGINNLDASLLKQFAIREADVFPTAAGSIQRGEPPGVRSPEHHPTSTTFGQITSQAICRGRFSWAPDLCGRASVKARAQLKRQID